MARRRILVHHGASGVMGRAIGMTMMIVAGELIGITTIVIAIVGHRRVERSASEGMMSWGFKSRRDFSASLP
ncbi:MAG TPA: hypothetical protein VGI40_16005 [Pirellulaceae bacterium]